MRGISGGRPRGFFDLCIYIIMASRTDELKTAVREALESRGVMRDLKTQIRAEVFKTLDHQPEEEKRRKRSSPRPEENLVINRLIKEYLQFNGYCYTCSVFESEAGSPAEGGEGEVSMDFIAQEMSLSHHPPDNTSTVPLLYQMIAHFKNSERTASTYKPHPPINKSTLKNPPPPSSTTGYHGNCLVKTGPPSNNGSQNGSNQLDAGHLLQPIVMEGSRFKNK